jgi:ribosomal protein L7/L12
MTSTTEYRSQAQLTDDLQRSSEDRLHMRDCIRGLTMGERTTIETCFIRLGEAMNRIQAEVDRRNAAERKSILLGHLQEEGAACEVLLVLAFLKDNEGTADYKLKMVKDLRVRTGWPLRDAKEFVEHIMATRGTLLSPAVAPARRCQVCGSYPELA